MSAYLTCQNLEKYYLRGGEKIRVLSDINLTLEDGEFLALMGPSGSGKSTLLNLIAGLDQPSAGSINVNGTRLEHLSSSALAEWRSRNIGFVFQFYNLLPVLNARRNVELPLLLSNLSGSRRKKMAMAALEVVGLRDRARHKPKELSGGQQQRVAIARAIVGNPDLLVCDEPTGDLDRASADEILELLQILNHEYGKTIVMVTHDPKAAQYAQRLLHLDKGQLVDGRVPA